MKLATAEDRHATMRMLDAVTQDSPAINAYFEERGIDPSGVAAVAILHARVARAEARFGLSVANAAALFAGGVALGLYLAEQEPTP